MFTWFREHTMLWGAIRKKPIGVAWSPVVFQSVSNGKPGEHFVKILEQRYNAIYNSKPHSKALIRTQILEKLNKANQN